MKILLSYTWNTLRQNKHSSLFIMAAILLSSTLLFTLCTFFYIQSRWRIDIEEYTDGTWHAELGGALNTDDLTFVESNLSVEKTMVKGPFTCVKLPSASHLPYLLLRDVDQNYWMEMGEKNAILEGRAPQKPGEIVVSKSFFNYYPQYSLGDTITLPVGNRTLHGENLDVEIIQEGEVFSKTGEITLTLVGKLDITTSTIIPGYYAMGFLDRSSLSPDQELVIYVKMKDIQKTYPVMSQLALSLDLEKNEFGFYENNFRYHTRLLEYYGVVPPHRPFSLKGSINQIVNVAFVLLVMGVFTFIIYGAFAFFAKTRLKQIGIFRSVGATPLQIGVSILFEGLILSILPILLSFIFGQLFTRFVFQIYTRILGEFLYFPIKIRFSFWVTLLSFLLSFLTALFSSAIPAWNIAKLSPIETIRTHGWEIRQKKYRSHPLFKKLFHFEGELAVRSHIANRQAYRASTTSLTLCLMLITSFFVISEINRFVTERNRRDTFYNIEARLQMTSKPDKNLPNDLLSISGIKKGVYYSTSRAAFWASAPDQSKEFTEKGGLSSIDLSRYPVLVENGLYRIPITLYGLENSFFNDCCSALGEDKTAYYDPQNPRVIVTSKALRHPDSKDPEKAKQTDPFLTFTKGQILPLEEKVIDSKNTDYTFSVTVGAYSPQELLPIPPYEDYNVSLYLPLDVYYTIVENFLPEYAAGYYRMFFLLQTEESDDLAITNEVRSISEEYLSTEDVKVWSLKESQLKSEIGDRAMQAIVNCIGGLLGFIGICNTLSIVAGSLLKRRREFAMLRSVGMDMNGIRRLLFLEGIRMSLTPLLINIPFIPLFTIVLLWMSEVRWSNFLPFFPFGKVFFVMVFTMVIIWTTYYLSSKQIRKDIIIEAIRDETI